MKIAILQIVCGEVVSIGCGIIKTIVSVLYVNKKYYTQSKFFKGVFVYTKSQNWDYDSNVDRTNWEGTI